MHSSFPLSRKRERGKRVCGPRCALVVGASLAISSRPEQPETREGARMNIRTADYVIIGAGSAGAALANRLTENGRHQVLLLEAGGETHPLSRVPVSFARFINRPGVNWLYASEPEPVTGGRAIPVPRGKMLGGSSAINGMVWVRGQRQDFDHWAQLGNRGWSYQDEIGRAHV